MLVGKYKSVIEQKDIDRANQRRSYIVKTLSCEKEPVPFRFESWYLFSMDLISAGFKHSISRLKRRA